MSKGGNESGLFVDTGLLRDHVSKLRNEKKIASQLYANTVAMKGLDVQNSSYQYDLILRDIDQLVVYFKKMADLLDHVDDEAVQLSRMVGGMIENDSERIQKIVSNTFML